MGTLTSELTAAITTVAGLEPADGDLDPVTITGQVAADLSGLLDPGRHYQLGAAVTRATSWPVRGAHEGGWVWWDPAAVTPYAAQRQVCGHVLHAKLHGTIRGVTRQLVPTFVIVEGRIYLIDGHHSVALLAMARARGTHHEPVPAFVYLPATRGLAVPTLDCNC